MQLLRYRPKCKDLRIASYFFVIIVIKYFQRYLNQRCGRCAINLAAAVWTQCRVQRRTLGRLIRREIQWSIQEHMRALISLAKTEDEIFVYDEQPTCWSLILCHSYYCCIKTCLCTRPIDFPTCMHAREFHCIDFYLRSVTFEQRVLKMQPMLMTYIGFFYLTTFRPDSRKQLRL